MHASDAILDTIETWLDTQWDGSDIIFGERTEGEDETVRLQHITMDGDVYLVMAKRVGGPVGDVDADDDAAAAMRA